jgi:DNA repair protein RadC
MSKTNPIKNWSESDQPREKLLRSGAESLSNAELIAILLRTGVAGNKDVPSSSAIELGIKLLSLADNDLNRLAKLPLQTLVNQIKGIGDAKALTLIAALELGKRRESRQAEEIQTITCSKDIYQILKPKIGHLDYEEFWLILLNRANRIIYSAPFSKGGIAGTVVDVRLIFRRALEFTSSGIVIAHNHPSGNLRPSEQDLDITKKIKNGASLLEMKLLDHLIVTDNGYYSFADEGHI